MKFILSFLFCLFVLTPAHAEDAAGSADHPRIPRLPGYEIQDYKAGDFASYDFNRGEGDMVTVEGRLWQISYLLKEGAAPRAALEVARNYQEAFKSKGGDAYDTGIDLSGGYAYAWMSDGDKEYWLEIDISNHGEAYTLTIIERAALKQLIEIGPDAIVKALEEEGKIALYGIYFDTGKSDIKPESAKTVDAITEALKKVPEMKVEIGGHTDNVGGADYNQTLSEARAQAVQQALIAGGIDAGRLSAKGYGLTVPVGANDTDEGRARNRRVELKKQ